MANVNFPAYFYQGQKILKREGPLGEVWLSGIHFAMDQQKLSELNIVAVLSAAELGLVFSSSIQHLELKLRDHEQEEIRHVFYPSIRFINQERKNGNVLIHCAAGISRSVSILIAYMMHRFQGSFQNCLLHVMRQRPCVMPNPGFTRQLMEFSKDLGIKEGARCFK